MRFQKVDILLKIGFHRKLQNQIKNLLMAADTRNGRTDAWSWGLGLSSNCSNSLPHKSLKSNTVPFWRANKKNISCDFMFVEMVVNRLKSIFVICKYFCTCTTLGSRSSLFAILLVYNGAPPLAVLVMITKLVCLIHGKYFPKDQNNPAFYPGTVLPPSTYGTPL